MKLTLVFLVAMIAVALAVPQCQTDSDCDNSACNHHQQVVCTANHQCNCQAIVKRQHLVCQSDADCSGFDCTLLDSGDTPYCLHHGNPEHGQNACSCQ